MGMKFQRAATMRQHLLDRISPEPNTGCWLWLGPTTTYGYGTIAKGALSPKQAVSAHRASYVEFVGPIADGWEIDHECECTHCINPDHLKAVTPLQHRWRTAARKSRRRHDWLELLPRHKWPVAGGSP